MLLTIITFFVVLSILVFVHELGHFWTARRFGVRAEEFGLGFPPRAIGFQKLTGERLEKIAETEEITTEIIDNKIDDGTEIIEEITTDKIKEVDRSLPFTRWRVIRGSEEPAPVPGMEGDTIYSLNWIPIGGFVKIKGEDGDSAEPDSFSSRPIWQRAIMLLSGVTMNIILAMALISFGFMIGLPQVVDESMVDVNISNRQIQIVEVIADSPAAKAELKAGDVVLSINGDAIINGDAMQKYVAANEGKLLNYKIKRGQTEFEKQITPVKMAETNRGGIGIGIAETGTVRYGFFNAIWQGVKSTLFLTWAIIMAFYDLLKNIFLGRGVSADLSGPVGIAVLTGQVAHMGFIYVLQFTAMLSINLAIINALPFPALDGGRALFLLIEMFKGSPVKRELEGKIHYIGFALLMLLVVVVTFRDIAKYAGAFKGLWERLF